ncbi:Tpt1/KptA family RNA 2'-phosphotransferase [Emericellopsis atlantica]|uniref:2'-phosphotransferase n=1 Tax=Emericellopsis atlantica TaxID=2614577 RepID=A0A9P7ZMQ0_9HYPO|nr:Tpt1/KptA family RNA 2'-phosphotransferase [Emericellopsis atlantica]KAG9254959.1 Tpt1/KptA family RNA 2'-phosphotransferase [Emericellopsis atlantica]
MEADSIQDSLESKARPNNNNRPRKNNNNGKGGSGQSRQVLISKALSRLLRHQATNAGITLDAEGYAPLTAVLAYGPIKSLQATEEEVHREVESNEKQRFSTRQNDKGEWMIRANQGHSIKIEDEGHLAPLTPDTVPAKVLHGTYFAFWGAIVESGGLKPMGRNHVHCSTGTPEEGVASGMRKDAELVIEVDVRRSMEEGGLTWWRSDNGVILTGGEVSTKWFKLVTGRKEDVGVLWADGEWQADLPSDLKMRVPQGKGTNRGRGRGRGGRGSRGS